MNKLSRLHLAAGVCLLTSLIACGEQAASDSEIIIFSASVSEQSAQPGWAAPYWEPSIRQISELESALPKYLREDSPNNTFPNRNLKSYGRQYFGFSQNGKKMIYLNAFCDPARFPGRKTGRVRVLDGGRCYFNVLYDPEKQLFSQLMYNGEA